MYAEAFLNNNWIRDLNHRAGFTTAHITKFVTLWNLVRSTELQPDREDHITWKLTHHGEYTTASAYRAQFLGCFVVSTVASIWKTWAPPKCRFFCMANPTKPCLDLGQASQERVGAQPNLPSMQNDDGNGASPACHLPLFETRLESGGHLDGSTKPPPE